MIGKSLSHYRIIEKLGQGGMGEVFLAEDSHLNRRVAIKVLPDAFARDPERLARFEREAKLLASLSHPNIAAIYGLEKTDGSPFLVMELAEGATLAQRIAKGPLAIDEALEVCRQIAEGLECAHEQGIIHRDLKPANVKVTPNGKVKILDFGLAKAFQSETATPDASKSPTITEQMTRAGVILGTAAYMSPEQARGKPVDARTDVWAFGCVLYELLTGRCVFGSETVTDILGAVVHKEPDWTALPPATPPPIRRLLARCLTKDARQRLHDIADARLEIDEAMSGTGVGAPAVEAVPGPTPARSRPWPWIIAATVATAVALAIAAVHFMSGPPQALLTTFTVFPEEKTALNGHVAVSPDGRRVVFGALDSAGDSQLWLRALDSVEIHRLPGTEGGGHPVWSPDGRWVGFFDHNKTKLEKIDIASGQVFLVADLGTFINGLDWTPDGTILFGGGPIRRVNAAGGVPEPLTVLDRSHGEVEHDQPRLLPGGKRFLFAVKSSQPGTRGIWVASLANPADRKRLLADNSSAAYAGGYLLFVHNGALMAQPFDPERAKLSGTPEAVAQKIGQRPDMAGASFDVSSSGVLAWSPVYSAISKATLTWFDRSGARLRDVGPAKNYVSVSLSHDGKWIAASTLDLNTKNPLSIIDLARGKQSDISRQDAYYAYPVWSPDASRFAFGVLRGSAIELFIQSLNGAGDPQSILENGKNKVPLDWSGDGRFLLYEELSETGRWSLWTEAMTGDRKAGRLLPDDFDSRFGQFSPDSRWIAYAAAELPVRQVWVQSFPLGRDKWQISTDGGDQPRWRGDGKELFYIDPLGKMMSVEIKPGAAFDPQPPKLLFPFPGSNPPYSSFRYDVTADGLKFIILTPFEETSNDPLHIVLNWTAALKK